MLAGRLVTPDGKPLADLELIALTQPPRADPLAAPVVDVTVGSFPRGVRTDKDGRFLIEGLAPGLKYRIATLRGMSLLRPEGDATKGVTVQAGETNDLGELKVGHPLRQGPRAR